ncbi:MAG: ATP-dependent DNA helicase DinG [Pseudomonadota bacterium]
MSALPAVTEALSPELKGRIQEAYRSWLVARGFSPRRGQREMIAAVARDLTDDQSRLTVIEAGTGTGKTAGYVIAAVPIAQALGKSLVIGTATVALQEQVVLRDLPDLKDATGLNFSFEIAKGRGRYLCVKRLDDQLREDGGQEQLLFETGAGDHQAVYQQMLASFADRSWDGELDSWASGVEPEAWRAVTTDHRGCTNKRCGFFRQCPFFRARNALDGVDVVVANQDLILADLGLGGGAVLPEPEDSIYVIDEAHHLPDKTQQHFSARAALGFTGRWTEQLANAVGTMTARFARPQALLDRAVEVSEAAAVLAAALTLVQEQAESLAFEARDDHTATYRFPLGVVPEPLAEAVGQCAEPLAQITQALERMHDLAQKAFEGELDWPNAHEAEDWLPVLGQLEGRAATLTTLVRDYARATQTPETDTGARYARWANETDTDIELVSAPIDPGRLLQDNFWAPAFAVVLTSATLTAMGRFDRYLERSGLSGDWQARTHRFRSPFDYPRIAQLVVPAMQSDPRDADAHSDEVATLLPDLLALSRSALVLFSSWRQMRAVSRQLDPTLLERVLMQGEGSKQALLAAHRQAIDDGATSYLFGLQSFAEGVDLPDDYCRHVIIAKLPFSVPDDPIDRAVSEWLEAQGRNPFYELQVPDAALRLEQACGRLIRHEGDHGRITLLDTRIVSKSYGRDLIGSLPPYELVIEG